ncbi:Uncharacterized protein YydD, contains DUF2326 domain [Nitrosospira sp. Nsp14]|uniref:DUF2326 domain-containing protein n=1 Tax=Nitrosospira sp. Nsp14 TaxID=1855333 RepID=UPI0008EC4334|nr:DUF2326 domain-containing protein [Nitrosospira sp. Nsp14]SFH61885.1 Uncharacterized protein YydD, contains DUF2326 domain [Nitrosospira sp. Nsp14]
MSHNLGKTTLIELIDHILFGSRDSDRIKAIKANFKDPVFTIDLLADGAPTKIIADYSKKRKSAFFSRELKHAYEYFIRFQDDYKDEFRKVSIRGKDITWKPLLLRLMGFDEKPLIEKYEIEATIQDYESFIQIAANSGMQRESKGTDIERLETRRSALLESIKSLNFSNVEDTVSVELASITDVAIANVKRDLFVNRKELFAINEALAHTVFIDLAPSKLEEIYRDLKIYFAAQVTRDLYEVEEFFQQITQNRTTALISMKKKVVDKILTFEEKLAKLTTKRADQLRLIISKDSIEIYRDLSKQLAQTETELTLLKQDIYKESIQTATAERNLLRTQQLKLAAAVASEIDENDSNFSLIKQEYRDIMREVMDIDAELVIEKNATGNLDFRTISWRDGIRSQELKGEMAKKISCAAFDVALRIVNNDDTGFIIHDGVIDNADKNIKQKFIAAMKSRASEHDFQYILTAINDDLPDSVQQSDIVITLSDRSDTELLLGKTF